MVAWLTSAHVFAKADTGLARAFAAAAKPHMSLAAQEIARDAKDTIVRNAPVGWRPPYYGEGRLSDRGHYVTRLDEISVGWNINFHVEGNARFMAKFHSVNSGSRTHPIDSDKWMPMIYEGGNRPARVPANLKHVKAGHGHAATHFYDNAIKEVIARARSYF